MLCDWELWACAQHYVRNMAKTRALPQQCVVTNCLMRATTKGARTYQAIIERINRLLEPPSGSFH